MGFTKKLRNFGFFGIRLARESANEEVKICKSSGVNMSDIFIKSLTPSVIQGTVRLLCKLVDLTPADKFVPSGSL